MAYGVGALRTCRIEEPGDTCLDVEHAMGLSKPYRLVMPGAVVDMASSTGPEKKSRVSLQSPKIPLSMVVDLPRSRESLEVVDTRLEVVEIPTAEADTVLGVARLTFASDSGDF